MELSCFSLVQMRYTGGMAKELTFREQLQDFFTREGAMSLSRLLVGGVLGGVVGSYGEEAALATGAALVGLSAVAHYGIQQTRKRVLSDFYREELAASLGKAPELIVPDDLDRAAEPPEKGGKGMKAIGSALDYFRDTRNFYIASQAITAGLITGALLLINTLPGMQSSAVASLALAGGAALAYDEVFRTVANIGAMFSTKELEGTLTRDVRAIAEQVSLGGRVSSTRVFGVFVEAQPELAKAIEAEFGTAYPEMSVGEKRKAVESYDAEFTLIQLTRDINTGRVRPTELAFAAYGQASGVARKASMPEPMHPTIDKETDVELPFYMRTMQSSVQMNSPSEALENIMPDEHRAFSSQHEKEHELFADRIIGEDSKKQLFGKLH